MTAPRSRFERLADVDAEVSLPPADREALAATRAELAALADPPVPPELARRWAAAIEAEHAVAGDLPPGGALDPARPGRSEPGASSTVVPVPGPEPQDGHGTVDGRGGRAAGNESGPLQRPARVDGPIVHDGAGPESDLNRADGAEDTPHKSAARLIPGSRAAGPPPRPRSRSPVWRRPAVLAAVLLAAVLAAASLTRGSAPAVGPQNLVGIARDSVGVRDAGGFDDPARRAECLRALAPPGVAAAAPLVGGRRVSYAGRDAVLLALGTGRRGVFDVVVIDPGCSVLLATARVGG